MKIIVFRHKIKIILFLGCFLSQLFNGFCQVKNIGLPEIKNFSKIEYKGGTQNWNIAEDSFENIYFANNDGLLQFDGFFWNKYQIPNNKAIRSLKIDAQNRIFVGGYNKFGYFKADENGKLIYNSLSDLLSEKQRSQIDFIWKIHIIDETVYFQSFENLYIYSNKKLQVLKAPNRFQFSFVIKNNLIVQDKKLGLLKIIDVRFEILPNTTAFNDTEIWGICATDDNNLLIASQDKGVFEYKNNTLSSWKTEANSFLLKNSCLGVTPLNNTLVFNSVLNGIIVVNLNGVILQHINLKNGIQNNTVLTSFVDKKSNLWLGLDNGISFVKENSAFSFFGQSYDLSTVYASVVYDNNLYVATNQGLFYHSWATPFQNNTFKLIEGTTGQAWNIQVIAGQLLCSHNKGLLLINNFRVQSNLDNKTGYWNVKTVPNKPNLLIGGTYSGFSVLENTANKFYFRNKLQGFDKSVTDFEINGANIWLKKDDNLYQLQFDDDFFVYKKSTLFKALSKNDVGINSIQKIDGVIYFQSKNNFHEYSEVNSKFIKNLKWTNIFSKMPTLINLKQDEFRNIWYKNSDGIGLFQFKNNTYKLVDKPFKILSDFVTNDFISINTVNNENVFIGLNNGLSHVNLAALQSRIIKPKVYINSAISANDTLNFGVLANFKEKIGINYKNNNIKFVFSSPNLTTDKSVQFSYLLDGFDNEWSTWSSTNSKEYTNLFEGNYEMKVRVKDSSNIISEPANFNFAISPPWYRHFIAYAFYCILFIVLIYIIRKRVDAKIRKNKYYQTIEQRKIYLEKEAKIKQEQYLLENEIERLKNEQLKVKLLSKDKELVNNSLQVVKKNKILNGIISNLKDFDSNSFNDENKSKFSKLNKSISKEVNSENSWKDLERHIRNVNSDFLKRLKARYPKISPRELDLSTYLLLNMSTKEIAEIMNISTGGVELARYRLRKKLELNKENLVGFLLSI